MFIASNLHQLLYVSLITSDMQVIALKGVDNRGIKPPPLPDFQQTVSIAIIIIVYERKKRKDWRFC